VTLATEVPIPLRHLIDANGEVVDGVSRGDIEIRLEDGRFFWLDLPQLGDDELTWFREVFHFHPLAIEDAQCFSERPKLEDYGEYVFMVLYGSASPFSVGSAVNGSATAPLTSPDQIEALSEVHCFISDHFLVTVHRCDCPVFRDLAARFKAHRAKVKNPSLLFHRVADTLVDSFFPVLSELDDRIDALQDAVIQRPRNEQLGELLAFKSALIALRRVIAPQRDIMAGLASGVVQLPGFDEEAQRYFRDIYDHLIRLSDLVDGYRDLLSGTTDAYLSVVSNQLNVVMKQLAIISTVFLPLSFLTGFFGQNFAWLVSRIGTTVAFFGIGLGTEAVAVGALMVLFWRRGWLGSRA
jgi:magnesium transporter